MQGTSCDSETATVIGVGAIGRQIALLLAALEPTKLQLIDRSVVKKSHIATQGFLADDIGRLKVHATADICQQVRPQLAVEEVRSPPHPDRLVGNFIFWCVENDAIGTEARYSRYERCRFWGEIRLREKRIVVTTGARPRDFARVNQQVKPNRSNRWLTLPVAMLAASLLVHQFMRFRAGQSFHRQVVVDSTSELVVTSDNG